MPGFNEVTQVDAGVLSVDYDTTAKPAASVSLVFEPTFWYIVLFTLGLIVALVGVGKLAQARANRRRKAADTTERERS